MCRGRAPRNVIHLRQAQPETERRSLAPRAVPSSFTDKLHAKDNAYRVIALKPGASLNKTQAENLFLKLYGHRAHCFTMDALYILLSAPVNEAHISAYLSRVLRRLHPEDAAQVYAGIGVEVTGLENLDYSFNAAKIALESCCLRSETRIIRYQDIGESTAFTKNLFSVLSGPLGQKNPGIPFDARIFICATRCR